jgi:hypothetical protein
MCTAARSITPAYLPMTQLRKPVTARGLGLSTAAWTGFWTRGRAGAEKTRARGWHGGAWAGAYRRIHFVNLFYFLSGPTRKAQEGASEKPEVYGHLRRVGGVFPVHPASSQPHLIKEATSGFRIYWGRHNRSWWVILLVLTNRLTNCCFNTDLDNLPLHPHQKPQ